VCLVVTVLCVGEHQYEILGLLYPRHLLPSVEQWW